jgi:hypothetical protein
VADDLIPEARTAAQSEPIELLRPRPADPPSVFRGRFAVAYLVLAVLAGIGIGGAVVLLDRPATTEATWSTWKPEGSRATFDDQIARYVSSRYVLPETGNPLVAVIPAAPTITIGAQELAVSNVVIQDDPEGDSDGFRVVDIDKSWMYRLCGLGTNCSIPVGTPSAERLQILRREALELALYTFKYSDDVDSVIAFLPPELGDADNAQDDTAVALFFEKSALRTVLKRPLNQTLVSASPPQGTELDPRESLIVERLTADRLFLYQFQPLQAGNALMHLLRPSSVR